MKYEPHIVAADHLQFVLDAKNLRLRVKWTVAKLRYHKFDAIAFRGLSGALVAPAVAMRMGKSLIAVRKAATIHSNNIVEGDIKARRYVIVDDFINSGHTVKVIVKEIRKVNKDMVCIGVCEFSHANPTSGRYTHALKTVRVTEEKTAKTTEESISLWGEGMQPPVWKNPVKMDKGLLAKTRKNTLTIDEGEGFFHD